MGDEQFYLTRAEEILQGASWHTSSIWPPLQSIWMAALLGISHHSILMFQLAQVGLLLATAWLLREWTRQFTGSAPIGNLAATLLLLDPTLAAYTSYFWPEIPHLFLMVAGWWLLSKENASARTFPLAGIVLGLALLSKSLLLYFLPVLLLIALRPTPGRQRLPRLGVFVLCLSLVLVPFQFMSWQREGLRKVADSSTFNLWVGLNDTSTKNRVVSIVAGEFRSYLESADTHAERERIYHTRIQEHIRERGLVATLSGQAQKQYLRLFDKDTFFTLQLDGDPQRGYKPHYANHNQAIQTILRILSYLSYTLILLLAPLGGFLLTRRRAPWSWMLLGFLLYNLALFFWLHVKTGYRFQMMPVFVIYAAGALDWISGKTGIRPASLSIPPLSRWQWACVGAIQALLLFLIYGNSVLLG